MERDAERALRELAESHGLLLAYEDIRGRRCEASPESLQATLAALGVPLERAADAPDTLRRRRQELRTRTLEPIVVSWRGERTEVRVRTMGEDRVVRCGLELESGETVPLSTPPELPAVGWMDVEGRTVVSRMLELPRELPLGYHRLWVEAGGRRSDCLLLEAPRTAWCPPTDGSAPGSAVASTGGSVEAERGWGLFLPLYALRTDRDWGVGDFTDLASLLRWTSAAGGRLVGTLPLLAAFLSEPFDPSPYAPVSRLFWNELYVDPTRASGWAGEGYGAEEAEAGSLEADLRELRARALVDHRRVAALKRRILEPLAERFFERGQDRNPEFASFLEDHPRAGDYARFRAVLERRGEPWPAWPARLRDGDLRPGDYDVSPVRYHLFVQWLAEHQLSDLAEAGRPGASRLYLDLPLGAHPAGYDCWREGVSFASGAAVGAPPDDFFALGQNWGFPPLHPERMRERGYAYFAACLRHSLRHAGVLRIDHVMGLHRLFWIPDGMAATDGVYVRYRSEELWALLCLESHRQRARIAGEDLGTVPGEVREAMARHAVNGLYVVQYEARPEAEPLSPRRTGQVASLNTHDMFPFAAWWEGSDVEERRALGLLDADQAADARRGRAEMRRALASFLQRRNRLQGPGTEAAMAGALEELAAGPSASLLVNLEDLWLESEPQNIPGTSAERPNWRRRSRRSLEEIQADPAIAALLRRLTDLRGRPAEDGDRRADEAGREESGSAGRPGRAGREQG